ncbi:MAG: hypothetical protein J6A67_05235 [Clostridia bacterium]|nr:hypothetical protein [Clostridia bacterium]
MSSVIVSVILPAVSSDEKFQRFCSSLFSGNLSIELLVCDNLGKLNINADYAEYVSVISSENRTEAINTAVGAASGKFLMFSDDSVIFAPEAIEKLIVASGGKSAVCNVGIIAAGECSKAFTDNFSAEDTATKPLFFNHLLSTRIVKSNSIQLCGSDSLSLMLFIADYYRFDSFNACKEVLMYTDIKTEFGVAESVLYLTEYATAFRLTDNSTATLFFISTVLSALLPSLNEAFFLLLKNIIREFSGNDMLMSWIRAAYGIDTYLLCDENSVYADFKFNGANIFYKEVTLPMLPDAVVRNFYSGKYGVSMLKKCIGAWLYYKFYCQKDGFLKKFGCKLGRKLLGGDFVG